MIYFNNKGVAIMGNKGFFGSELAKRDLSPGVYFFSSPSSIVLFNQQMDWCMRDSINDFINVISYCRDTGTYLVFPSSATVVNKNTAYSHCKAAIEEIYYAYNIPALGLRIAAGYGPAEKHKGEHASVVYQWCKQMSKGERPVIFGDGTQSRDFIYQDDVIDTIESLAKKKTTGIIEVGTGKSTTFNEVVQTINVVLGTRIVPVYVDKPKHYVQETKIGSVPTKVNLEEGIRRILKSL